MATNTILNINSKTVYFDQLIDPSFKLLKFLRLPLTCDWQQIGAACCLESSLEEPNFQQPPLLPPNSQPIISIFYTKLHAASSKLFQRAIINSNFHVLWPQPINYGSNLLQATHYHPNYFRSKKQKAATPMKSTRTLHLQPCSSIFDDFINSVDRKRLKH